MKNIVKIMGIILLSAAFLMTACLTTTTATQQQAEGPGTLIITGLDEYNGNYICASGEINEKYISAGKLTMQPHPMTGEEGLGLAGILIENGSAVLNVWEANYGNFTDFSGSDSIDLEVQIWREVEVYHWHYGVARGNVSAAFDNGNAEAAFVLEANLSE